jgi:hypothetical protein
VGQASSLSFSAGIHRLEAFATTFFNRLLSHNLWNEAWSTLELQSARTPFSWVVARNKKTD